MVIVAWAFIANADLVISHYGSTEFIAKWNGWWHPNWSGKTFVIGLLVIVLLMVFEGSYRHTIMIERARDKELAESKTNLKEARARLYEGHPILVLHLGRVARGDETGPSTYTLHLQNCGNRPARWVNTSITRSTGKNYHLSFGRIAVIEPQATESLLFTVHGKNESTASFESFLEDTPEDTYVTWYDLEITFRDSDESGRTDTARLAYWPKERVLGSVEVPYTKKEFKQP